MASLTREARRTVLAGMALFAGLAREDLDALAGLATEVAVAKDHAVVRRGDPGTSMMVVVHGRLRAGAVSIDGRELTHGLLEPGAMIGEIALVDGQPRSLDVIAMQDSVLLALERATFLPFMMARPHLMLRMMTILCERLRRSSVALEDVALLSLQSRLARLLLSLAETHGRPTPDGTRIALRLSQRELSAQVAATRERVNKQLRQWHDQGVVGEANGEIVVRRPEVLRSLLG